MSGSAQFRKFSRLPADLPVAKVAVSNRSVRDA
jgi:hypothetical protein